MPWHLEFDKAGCKGKWAVVKDADGKTVGCHDSKAKATAQLAALNINVKGESVTFPRENITRDVAPRLSRLEVRDDPETPPTLFGHFAVFDQWEEIDSLFEGHFMERVSPGSFAKTFSEKRDRVKATFNHGHDPDLGDKVLGKISDLSEDSYGARYEVPLFPSVPPLLVEGLRAGEYGSSFRFRVTREEIADDPGVAEHNPGGLPERTIKEVELYEFGPVTFPAYEGATAGVRSVTDDEVVRRLLHEPARFAHIIEALREEETAPLPEEPAPATPPVSAAPRFRTREEFLKWMSRI